jgi:hypothetical protein
MPLLCSIVVYNTQPILDTVETMQLPDRAGHQMHGIVSVSFYWRDWLTNILPEGSNGILAVFENECSPSFTFQINGQTVEYLGRGDLHDAHYDNLGIGVRPSPVCASSSILLASNQCTVVDSGPRCFVGGRKEVHRNTCAQ